MSKKVKWILAVAAGVAVGWLVVPKAIAAYKARSVTGSVVA